MLNFALVPVASVYPEVPAVPAKVVTTAVAITIFLIACEPEATTYKFVPSLVIPYGYLNAAEVPVPFVVACVPEPANVVVVPSLVIFFIILLLKSQTYAVVPTTVIP